MEQENKIVLFEEKQIRSQLSDNEWYFNLVDVIEVLTDSPQPRVYWSRLRKKILEDAGVEMFPNWKHLKFRGKDGKNYTMDAANTEGVLRIIMAVPSPKAEPFRQWLAQAGREKIEEIQDPELGIERLTELYKAKGYDNEWIDYRLKSIGIRKELTEEWQKRGVKEGQEYSILTAEIARATFGLTPREHKNLKGLENENLRDHMTNLELLFTALGEEFTRNYAIKEDAQGFEENQDAAIKGGNLAGDMRKNAEKKGMQVISPGNHLDKKLKNAAELPPNEE